MSERTLVAPPRWRLFVILCVLGLVASACSGTGGVTTDAPPTSTPAATTSPTTPAAPTEPPTVGTEMPTAGPIVEPTARPVVQTRVENGFDTRTLLSLESTDEYWAMAREGVGGQQITKFTIADFGGNAELHWYDSNFFTLHDEWYWYWMLNGLQVPGGPNLARTDLSFATVADVYAWAQNQDDLPYEMSLRSDGRLVAHEVYSLANADADPDRKAASLERWGRTERLFVFGSLIYQPARTEPEVRPAHWVIELEYSDAVTIDEISEIIEIVTTAAPPEIVDDIQWVVRSPAQEETARSMEITAHPEAQRIIRYDELVVPGEVQVYNGAITAGRIMRVGEGEKRGFDDTDRYSIVLTDQIPDYLPQAAALITSVPQTPLAHVNILARNRGIPNAYQAGLFDNPNLNSMARVLAPAVVYAAGSDELEIVQITEAEYMVWFRSLTPERIAVPQVDAGRFPYVLDLTDSAARVESEADIESLRPLIGGKAAGFLGLAAPGNVIMPDAPQALTVRAYREHIAQLDQVLETMLNNETFKASTRARYLVLEGLEDFDEFYNDTSDLAFRERYFTAYPAGTVMGDIVAAGGFKRMIRDLPIDRDTLAEIDGQLRNAFGDYSNEQGLRFRSSSSVEDIEGFNGAGLYDSNTGFLNAEALDSSKTIEWAIKKTWASYWSSEAFEERKLENVDHLSGGMAVLVHARFDDELEVSNGVFTFSILPDGNADRYVLELNVQVGAESVTNPTAGSGSLPEVNVMRWAEGDDSPSIERLASSTLAPGEPVLSDAQLVEIFESARAVSTAWLDRSNAELPIEQQASSLTLDFEFREMDAGWPALLTGRSFGSRIVIKQARSLDPGIRGASSLVRNLPIPVDLLARARRVQERTCVSLELRVSVLEVLVDGSAYPEAGYSEEPFVAQVSIEVFDRVERLDMSPGERVALSWLDLQQPNNGGLAAVAQDQADDCDTLRLHETPEDYLLSLLPE